LELQFRGRKIEEKISGRKFGIEISFGKSGWPEIRAGIYFVSGTRNQFWRIQFELTEISSVPKSGSICLRDIPERIIAS
jgi:hypothetical protein